MPSTLHRAVGGMSGGKCTVPKHLEQGFGAFWLPRGFGVPTAQGEGDSSLFLEGGVGALAS